MDAKEVSPDASETSRKPEEDIGTAPPPETSTTEEAKEPSPNASEISMEEIGPEAEEEFGGVVIEEYPEIVTVDGEVKLEAKPPGEEGDAPGPSNVGTDETAPPKAPPPTAASSSAMISRAKPEESSDDEEDNEDEDFEDETLVERLIGLTEMFPAGFTSGVSTVVGSSVAGAKWGFSMSKSLTWLLFSTATVLFLPIMIETERVGIEEAQKQQQRQILLGPGVAASAGQNAPLPKF